MKKATISISFDEEKLNALKMYLAQRDAQVESELEKALDTLYAKTVPAGVRAFIDMKSGGASDLAPKPPRRPRPSSSSAVGATEHEVKQNA